MPNVYIVALADAIFAVILTGWLFASVAFVCRCFSK